MTPARLALAAAVLAAAPAPLGCAKKLPPSAVVVVEDTTPPPADAGAGAGDEVEAAPARPQNKPQGKPIHVRAALHGLGDLLSLIKQATTAWTPKQPLDPAAQIQALLLQSGYGPGLWASLDLAGPFALDASFFSQEPSVGLQFTGSLAALSAKGIMEGMPSAQRPQPLGNGLWELLQGELRVLLREGPKSLEFTLNEADLGHATKLADQALQGRRLQLRAWDLPPGMIGSEYFRDLPGGLRKQVAAIMREMSAASLELDAGTDRDLALQLVAEAPFARLGLAHLGPPSLQSSPLEALLPQAPVFVVAMPWGDPKTLHAFLDKNVRLDAIPAPFDKVASDAIASVHAILDQLARDLVFALYLSPKGEATFVLAANIKDEAATRAALRTVLQAAHKGLEAFNAITGDDKSAKLGLTFKADGAKAGNLKADLFSIALAKNMQKEADDFSPFLLGKTGKKKIDALSFVSGQLAVFALGAGAHSLVADLAQGLKTGRKTSLGADPGLRLARLANQGCHFCVSLDPAALLRLDALTDTDDRKNTARLKQLDAASTTFTRLGGTLGLGLTLDAQRGALGLGLPKSILILSPADAASLTKLWADDEPPATTPADKPLSGPARAGKPARAP